MFSAVPSVLSLSPQELRAARVLALPRVARSLDPVVVQLTGRGPSSNLLADGRQSLDKRAGEAALSIDAAGPGLGASLQLSCPSHNLSVRRGTSKRNAAAG